MIALIRGTLVSRRPDHVVVDVGGVGYRLFVTLTTFYDLPEPGVEVTLLTQTVVRDDAIHLYGFLTPEEKEAFGLLTQVSGVGPKLGLSILSGISALELWTAVQTRDTARLCKVPGIGKKTAGRLVLELEGRLPEAALVPGAAAAPAAAAPAVEDAASALMNLGYPEAAAAKAVQAAAAELGEGAGIEDLLKAALKRVR